MRTTPVTQRAASDSPQIPSDDHTPYPKKEALKRKFDAHMTIEFSHLDFDQLALNRVGFEGIGSDSLNLVKGYRPGQYIRIQLADVHYKMIENIAPIYPIIVIVGGLLSRKNILAWKIFKVTTILFRFETISKHPYLFF